MNSGFSGVITALAAPAFQAPSAAWATPGNALARTISNTPCNPDFIKSESFRKQRHRGSESVRSLKRPGKPLGGCFERGGGGLEDLLRGGTRQAAWGSR